jgi:hypothetical protein
MERQTPPRRAPTRQGRGAPAAAASTTTRARRTPGGSYGRGVEAASAPTCGDGIVGLSDELDLQVAIDRCGSVVNLIMDGGFHIRHLI